MRVWQLLQANLQPRFAAPVQPMVTFEQPSPQTASKPKKKRPASGENIPSAAERVIQPQLPLNFPPVNPPSEPPTDQGVTASVLGGPPKKKRGRPSKVEYEAKVAEAAARGEEYQPTPKRKKPRQPSLQGAPNVGIITPGMTEVGAAGEVSAGRERVRTSKAAPEVATSLASEPTARSLALEATALAAGRMQTDQKQPFRSTIPETQFSEADTRERLLADIRENAERTAPDTVQSSMTLQHDFTPHSDFASYQGATRGPVTTGEQQIP